MTAFALTSEQPGPSPSTARPASTCPPGRWSARSKPAFGRSYQTPFADRIRNEIGTKYGVAVIAVGAISSYDDVNSIILAGRADLCALGRPPVRPAMDPARRRRAGVHRTGRGPAEPSAAGRRRPQGGRTDGPRPRLELIRAGTPGTAHARWRPSGAPAADPAAGAGGGR